jgi:hypothetical protein
MAQVGEIPADLSSAHPNHGGDGLGRDGATFELIQALQVLSKPGNCGSGYGAHRRHCGRFLVLVGHR